jgi:NAD-dependent SIR2 family protein deacetylase
MRETLNCHECGKEYYADELIPIDDDKDVYYCDCGYENLYI